MEIELQFISVIVRAGEIEETYPLMFSALQPYFPVRKSPKRKRARKKRVTVASLIDPIIENIERDSSV